MEENSIKNKKLLCLLLSVVMTASVLTGCTTKNNASEEETETTEESLNTEEHEPLTLIDSGQDYGELIDFVHENTRRSSFRSKDIWNRISRDIFTDSLKRIRCRIFIQRHMPGTANYRKNI